MGPASRVDAATIVTEPPPRTQRRVAWWLCLLATLATICLLPLAAQGGSVLPGFMLIHQTALVITYALSA